jgi:DNA-binding SARP family transcriptional activator
VAVVEIRIFGPVEIEIKGVLVSFQRRQERCLLGILALEQGRYVTMDRLADLLWGPAPPAAMRTAIYALVSRVRAALRQAPGYEASLVTRGTAYALLVDEDVVDAHRFRAMVQRAGSVGDPRQRRDLLRAALDLWRGPLLADMPDAQLRDRLGMGMVQVRWEAVGQWAQACLACGQPEPVIAELTDHVTAEPAREELVRLLMLALYRCGRQAEALAVYQRVRKSLVDDLGIEPAADLQQVQMAILRGEPVAHPSSVSVGNRLIATAPDLI